MVLKKDSYMVFIGVMMATFRGFVKNVDNFEIGGFLGLHGCRKSLLEFMVKGFEMLTICLCSLKLWTFCFLRDLVSMICLISVHSVFHSSSSSILG